MSSLRTRIVIAAAGFYLVAASCTNQDQHKEQKAHNTEKLSRDTTLTGDYVCLPHRGVKPGEPTTAECAFGLQGQNGKYIAINLAASSQPMINLQPGDRVRISGTLMPVTKADSQWYRYEANELLNVTSGIEKVTYPANGVQYSSEQAAKEIFTAMPRPGSTVNVPFIVNGRAREHWFSRGQWGPEGTMRLMLEDENGMQIGEETTVLISGGANEEGFIPFTGMIRLGEHTTARIGYVVIYQSNFSKRREYVKVPVRFQD